MKNFSLTLRRYAPWLLLLLALDLFSALLLWVSNANAFGRLVGAMVLASVILYATVIAVVYMRDRRRQALFAAYLSDPDDSAKAKLLAAVSEHERPQLRLLFSVMDEKQRLIRESGDALHDYEEYVEGWAHEAKTPLSLLTMVLDNHADELPQDVHAKLDYVRGCLNEDVTQMLYYARLGSSTKDYRFEQILLRDAMQDVLDDYAPLLAEKHFSIENSLLDETVFTDRRGLEFMLGQIVSNAVKYSGAEPRLKIKFQGNTLTIADNGRGIKACDLPYIFQKGFTGDPTDSRKKATGMGLYLAKRMAADLNLTLDAASGYGTGTEIMISFPRV